MHDQQQPPDAFAERGPLLPERCPRHLRIAVAPARRPRSRAASISARMMPGTMPAMNSAPIEVLVETPYSTRMIDGGTRCRARRGRDHADAETPRIAVLDHRRHHDRADRNHRRDARPNRGEHRAGRDAGKPEAAGQMPDQRGREGDHAPRDAAAGQESAGQDEKRDRHDPKLSRPETASARRSRSAPRVIVNRKVSTDRPSEIEIGMPVSISANSSPKIMRGAHHASPSAIGAVGCFDALDMGRVMMRHSPVFK